MSSSISGTELFGRPLRGNIGVRYVETDVRRRGLSGARRRHPDRRRPVLRRLAAVRELQPRRHQQFRRPPRRGAGDGAAAARQSCRRADRSTPPATLSITTGNPLLEPFRADHGGRELRMVFRAGFAPRRRPLLQGYRHLHPEPADERPVQPDRPAAQSLLPANFTGNELFLVTAADQHRRRPAQGLRDQPTSSRSASCPGRCNISARSSTSPMSNRRSTM